MEGIIHVLTCVAWFAVIWVLWTYIASPIVVVRYLGFWPTECTECSKALHGRFHVCPGEGVFDNVGDFDAIPIRRATPSVAYQSEIVCDACFHEYQLEKEHERRVEDTPAPA